MPPKLKRGVVIFLLLLSIKEEAPASSLHINFTQGNQSYGLVDSLAFVQSFSNRWRIQLINHTNYLLLKKTFQFGKDDQLQKYASSELQLRYQLGSRSTIAALLGRDNISTKPIAYEQNRLAGIWNFQITPWLGTAQSLGWVAQNKGSDIVSRRNTGVEFGWQVKATLPWSRLPRTTFSASVQYLNLPRLPQQTVTFMAVADRLVPAGDTLRLQLQHNRAGKTYYYGERALTGTARQHTQNSLITASYLKKFFHEWIAQTEYTLSRQENLYRPVDIPAGEYDSVFSDLRRRQNLFWSQTLRVATIKTFFNFLYFYTAYRWEQAREDYGIDFKDQKRETAEVEVQIAARLSSADSVAIFGSTGVSSYFVPPISGFYSDRDLITSSITIAATHFFNPLLSLVTTGSRRILKQQYISGRFSANNRTTDMYRFAPAVRLHSGKGFLFTQSFNLIANYISFDFQKYSALAKHSLFRQAGTTSAVEFMLTERLIWTFEGAYRYQDLGSLLWREQWVQQTQWDERSKLLASNFRYSLKPLWQITGGFAWEDKKRFEHRPGPDSGTVLRPLATWFIRRTLSLGLRYGLNNTNYLRIELERRKLSGTGFAVGVSDWITISYGKTF